MELERRFEPGSRVVLLDSRGRRYLITLQAGGSFHSHRGIVEHDSVLGEEDGSLVRTTTGEEMRAFRPTLSEFVLKMPRGAQVVYPKDIAAIIVQGDLYPGATVLEAGVGSGGLTIGLLRAVGPQGRVISYEVREDFAETARDNIESFLGPADNLEIRIGSVYDGVREKGIDRAVLDLPEPWRAVAAIGEALRGGGIFVAYLPTIIQSQRLTQELQVDSRWSSVLTTETLVRAWKIEGTSVRPEHRMVGHTGFITVARRVVPL